MVELYGRFRVPLNAYFQRRAPACDVEDLTQEVFLRLARQGDRISLHRIEALIFTIAGNLLRDRRRRLAIRGQALSVEQDIVDGAEANLVETIEPERLLIGRSALDRAATALGELPPRTRDVFVLARLERRPYRDIGQALGISVSAVEKHMVRALSHLGQRLA